MRPVASFQRASHRPRRWGLVAVASLLILLLASSAILPVFAEEGGSAPDVQPALATPTPPVPERPGQPNLHPVGIGLAVLFLFLMITLFRWMFRVPPHLPYAVVKARQSVSALRRILVPTTEELASERAVELACRLGEIQKAEIILAYIVEVPLTLSLNTPMPSEEAKGQEALRTAQFIVEQHGLPVTTRLIPHRYIWNGIVRLAREEMVDAIVMNVGDGRPGQAEGIGRTAQEVLKRAECEVVLDKRAAWITPAGT